MAKNYYQDGTTMDWSNSTGKHYLSGDPVPVGEFTGVAHGDIPDGTSGVLHTVGVWILPKNGTETWPRGAKVYLIPGTGKVTLEADDGAGENYPVVGTAWITVNPSDTACRVRLGF